MAKCQGLSRIRDFPYRERAQKLRMQWGVCAPGAQSGISTLTLLKSLCWTDFDADVDGSPNNYNVHGFDRNVQDVFLKGETQNGSVVSKSI
jgi:hypothetical protein